MGEVQISPDPSIVSLLTWFAQILNNGMEKSIGEGEEMGELERNKAIVRREVEEVWNGKRLDLLDEIFAANFVNHDPNNPQVTDRESFRVWASAVLNGFPDLYLTIDDVVAEGDKVACRWTHHGTHLGELPGLPATGKKTTITGIIIYRFAKGKVVEAWWSRDLLGLMQQLGVIPTPNQT